MTDDENERMDLSALDAADDPVRRDAVLAAVMQRVHSRQQRSDVVLQLLRPRRRLAVATAALAALAAVALLALPGPTANTPSTADEKLLGWMNASRTPSNAELLTVFLGYRP